MKKQRRQEIIYALDFETTVYEGQQETEVWSSAGVEVGTDSEKVFIDHSIQDTYERFESICNTGCDILGYYHNLKFDGYFWVDYLLRKGYTAIDGKKEKLKSCQLRCTISDLGSWYIVEFSCGGGTVTLLDSLKLIPFSLEVAGKNFDTKHKKLKMEYKGRRFAGCSISDEEKKYIENDVLVLKECLEYMFSQGHDSLTIAGCCKSEFYSMIGYWRWMDLFPDLTKITIDSNVYGAINADEYIRKSYHGGWCYVVPDKTNRVYKNGVTADVNSLYPSMMSSESGNVYPVGKPHFWKGNFIPEKAKKSDFYYFVRFKCRFRIKEGYLPFVQIKGSKFYKSTEMLESSELTYKGKKYSEFTIGDDVYTSDVTLTMTQEDYKLFHEHYNVSRETILDGCYFWTEGKIFDEYIDKYRRQKIEASKEGNKAKKTVAKLFLNSLYGKLSASDDSSHQIPYLDKEKDVVKFVTVVEHKKKAGYIAIGSAITSYARNFTIRAAQKNFYGYNNKYGFIYADTDSIHCALKPDQKELNGIKVDDTAFCCWKLESNWDEGIFVRQKTYIEHVTHEDGKQVDNPYYNIKCAGMPSTCKNKIDDELKLNTKALTDFKAGLEVDGKLMPKKIHGGVILVDTTYKMK